MKAYYDRRATEYDDWWEGARARPGWDDDLAQAMLVVLGSRWRESEQRERWEERRLSDGTTWPVYKRVFELAAELGGETVHAGRHFVAVCA